VLANLSAYRKNWGCQGACSGDAHVRLHYLSAVTKVTLTRVNTRNTLNAQFDSPGRPVWTVKQPSGVDSGADEPKASRTIRIVVSAQTSLAVLWTFGAYEFVRNMRMRAAFGWIALLNRWMTPACITCTVAVFAGVILLRS
jgi:hypothetical protein